MPINESTRRPSRERYPLAFDLEGIPRDNQLRDRLVADMRGDDRPEQEIYPMDVPKTNNIFAGDANALVQALASLNPAAKQALTKALLADAANQGGKEFDLSKPPVEPYVFREFPKAMYSPDGKKCVAVNSPDEQASYEKRKYTIKPPAKKDDVAA